MFENGFRTITDYVIHLWSWNFIHLLPMSQGCALLILGSKGQRSRSWIIDVWKWFPDHNWLCNPPMIMKLHTLAPHESRMCPIDFGVKRSTVKVMAHGYLKMVHRNNGCRYEFVGVGGGPVLLQQYFQYAFICCPYMLPLLLNIKYCIHFSQVPLFSHNSLALIFVKLRSSKGAHFCGCVILPLYWLCGNLGIP